MSSADTAADSGTDPRLPALHDAVAQLRQELDGYAAPLADRRVAERELAVLDMITRPEVVARAGLPDATALRRALLLVVAAIGSVSALAPDVRRLREAVDLFAAPPTVRIPAGRTERN
ncbi:DUF5955 family protein [Streptomyces sodiiphilus]|uniref:DUF5955 family protein n=1 Tax=Streptomyces sodiiphilus TaxID=226217 RepID=A0ABP5B8U7_9ACTN